MIPPHLRPSGPSERGRRLIVADGALSRAEETLRRQRRGPVALRASKRCTACNTQSACHEDNNGERHELVRGPDVVGLESARRRFGLTEERRDAAFSINEPFSY